MKILISMWFGALQPGIVLGCAMFGALSDAKTTLAALLIATLIPQIVAVLYMRRL